MSNQFKTVTVITYDIRNGYQGPMVFKNREAALSHLREDLKDALNEDQFQTLEKEGRIDWGRDNSLSLDDYEVYE